MVCFGGGFGYPFSSFFCDIIRKSYQRPSRYNYFISRDRFWYFYDFNHLFFRNSQNTNRQIKKIKKNSKTKRFFLGMLLSALNFFPIPYYVFVSITLASYNLFSFDTISILIFVKGVVIGSFLVFYIYISFFNRIETKRDYIMKNMNTIIGSITGLISIITLINIIKYYW